RYPPHSRHDDPLIAPPESIQFVGRTRAAPHQRRSRRAPSFHERVMFALFERLLKPTAMPEHPEPPSGLIGFYWHFSAQAKGLLSGLFVAGFLVAVLDSLIPVFIGRIVTLITASKPEELFANFWPILLAMALVLLILRPLALTSQNIMANQAIAANVGNLIRWQSHWHVVRQSWAFFQNDFAGRIANRVMQTGP